MKNQTILRGETLKTEFAHTLAIYCSDGRFAPACEQYIRETLGEEWFDRFVVPGGAGGFCLNALSVWKHHLPLCHSGFLIEAHAVRRVILIAHEDCGFYQRFKLSLEETVSKQIEDLRATMRCLRQEYPGMVVEAYYLRVADGQPIFEPVRD